jgi:tRNA G18 (ribose-2'-O)-methylase SpoU
MRDVIHVADVGDSRLSDYAAIDPRIPRRDVERAAVVGGYAICEGPLLVRRTLETGIRVRSVLVTPSRLRKLADILETVEAPIYVAEKPVLEEVVGYAFHRGAVASVERPLQPEMGELLAGARRVAVCEGITDHENLGSIFRNAAAFGLDAVLLDPTTCDPLYRRSIRVSMGHALRMPWARVEPWPDGLDRLREAGLTCAALTPGPGSITLEQIDRSRPIAFMLGTEGPGLTAMALARADIHVRIPMAPGVDSLNVAATSALAFRAIADGGLV